jgi:hypothetical protein
MLSHRQNSRALRGWQCASCGEAQSHERVKFIKILPVGYKRVSDSLNTKCIWKELKARGFPSKFLNLIRQGYYSFSCRIYHNGHLSELFLTTSGVRHSCLLSPLLFLLVLDRILKRTMNDRIAWKWMNSLEDHEYADDIVCLFHPHITICNQN